LSDTLHISVRDLVHYMLRSGDLNLTFFGSERPVQAIRAHQAIQESRPEEYIAEVPVHHEVETDRYLLDVSGRIDGIYQHPEHAIIEEIKTTRKPLAEVEEEDNSIHWGQAKCYAYMYAAQNNLSRIDVQLTYYNIDLDKTTQVRRSYDMLTLKAFFDSLITQYLAWADKIMAWIEIRNQSIASMKFPFVHCRPGQTNMMEQTALAFAERIELLIQAPTGIGKTMAVVFPAIQAIAQGRAGKIFYLTARTTGRGAAEQAIEILKKQGLELKYLSLTAKEKICFNNEKLCNGEECTFARGFYDRISDALHDAYGQDSYTRDIVMAIAEKHRICPFEFSLELAQWVDFIICDYNYVFDPRVYLKRFFEDGDNDYILMVDEAHNLVDRSRDMYSATIDKKAFLNLRKRLRTRIPDLYQSLGKVNSWMNKVKNEFPEGESNIAKEEYPADLCQRLRKFTSLAEQWLARNEHAIFRQELLDLYFVARRFLNTIDRYDETYATHYSRAKDNLSVKLLCIDSSKHLAQVLKRCSAAVFFSATLTPMQYFARLFGCDDNARTLSLPSPFPSENLCILIAGKISALYKYREFTKFEVARMVSALIDQKKGNYLIFFPSYEYMRMVHEIFKARRPRNQIIVQEPNMSERERERFLGHFDEPSDGYLKIGRAHV